MKPTERAAKLRQAADLYGAGRAGEAASLLLQIEFADEERATPEYATYCLNLGAALAESGELRLATRYFAEAESYYENREEWNDAGLVAFNLGNVHKYASATRLAQRYYAKALKFSAQAGDIEMQMIVRVTWANYLADLGDFEAVNQHLIEIDRLQSNEEGMDDELNWSLHCLKGKLALAEQNTDKAIEYLHEALEFARRFGNDSYVADTMGLLGEAMRAASEHADAHDWLTQAENLRASIGKPRIDTSVGNMNIAQSQSLKETIDDLRADSLSQIIKTSLLESNGAEATGKAAKQPAESAQSSDTTWSTLVQSHSPSSISRESKAELEAIAEEMNVCMLLLRITAGQDMLVPVKGIPSILEIEIGSENMSGILDIIRLLGQPEAQADLIGIAHHLGSVGIEMRQQGQYYTALLCYRFALAVATHYRDWSGIKSLTWNIWMIQESIKDLLRVNVTPPFPDGPESATLTQLPFIAGNIIMMGSTGPTMQPEEEYLVFTAELIQEDAQLLLSAIKTDADEMLQVSGGAQALLVFQSLRRLAEMAGNMEVRRSVLAKLHSLATILQRHDIALKAILEELCQVTEFDLLIDSHASVTSYRSEGERVVQYVEPDHGFRAVWGLYLEERNHIDDISDIESLLQRYAIVFRQMQSLRWKVTCAGGATGHRFSYKISSFLQPIGRDYVHLLMKMGSVETAFAVAEQVHARSMTDWMARTHHTNRLVRDNRLRGSLNAVIPAGQTEIRRVAQENAASILVYLETRDGYEVWLQQTNGDLVAGHIENPHSIIARVLENLPYASPGQDIAIAQRGQRHLTPSGETRSSVDKLNANLGQLYLALFPPEVRTSLCNAKENEKLVIIPDSLLEYVPFCALRTDDDRYLIEKHELQYWPSVTSWLLTESAAKVRKTMPDLLRSQYRRDRFDYTPSELPPLPDVPTAVIMGNPSFSQKRMVRHGGKLQQVTLSPLPGTVHEARIVGELLDVTPLLGDEASLGNLLDFANVIPVVHLATHGVLVTEHPEDSFVALSGQELTANFLYQSDRPILAELVVMSACQTALGGEHPDSLIGLTNAVLIAGANTVVSTLWQIDDLRTVRLVTRFYEELKKGRNVAAALRIAQLQILQEPELRHPYYWAAFKITGNSTNPLPELQ